MNLLQPPYCVACKTCLSFMSYVVGEQRTGCQISKFQQTCSLSEAERLIAVRDPAVDGKVVGFSLRGRYHHLVREP